MEMENTQSDTDNDTAETHEATVRRYLRSNDALTEPTHLTAGDLSETQVAA